MAERFTDRVPPPTRAEYEAAVDAASAERSDYELETTADYRARAASLLAAVDGEKRFMQEIVEAHEQDREPAFEVSRDWLEEMAAGVSDSATQALASGVQSVIAVAATKGGRAAEACCSSGAGLEPLRR